MFGKIFKGLAVAAGVGFAIGMAAGKRRQPREKPREKPAEQPREDRASGSSSDQISTLERLDRIESRITAVEARPLPVIEAHSKDFEALRLQMDEYRQRIASDVAVIQKGLADVTKGIPAMLESIVAPRVEDLRLHLRSEAQQSIAASLTRFERAFEDKVSDRIAALEKVMLDQSALMTALSHRAIESEMNMERLISAVGRLCDQTGESPDPPLRNHVNGAAPEQSATIALPTRSSSGI